MCCSISFVFQPFTSIECYQNLTDITITLKVLIDKPKRKYIDLNKSKSFHLVLRYPVSAIKFNRLEWMAKRGTKLVL